MPTTPHTFVLRAALACAGLLLPCQSASATPEYGADTPREPTLAVELSAPATDIEDSVALIRRGAQATIEAVEAREIWLDEAPSSTSHKLLACGRACARSQGPGTLWHYWKLSMSDELRHVLHRGEFLALAADLGVARSETLMLTDGEATSVGALLTELLDESVDPGERDWNAMEADHDHELGWVRSAACRYLSSDELARSDWRETLLDDELPSSLATEGGTHELEGMAMCAALHAHEGSSLRWALEQRLANDLAAMAGDGQLYRHDASFTTCPEGDAACQVFGELNRQAHFFEWVALLPELRIDSEIERALGRWAALVDEAEMLAASDAPLSIYARMLAASASSHSVHAAHRLSRRLDPSADA